MRSKPFLQDFYRQRQIHKIKPNSLIKLVGAYLFIFPYNMFCMSRAYLTKRNSQFQNHPCSPTPPTRHLTFLNNFAQISLYVGSLDGEVPHRLTIQKVTNPLPTSNYSKIFPCVELFTFKCDYIIIPITIGYQLPDFSLNRTVQVMSK